MSDTFGDFMIGQAVGKDKEIYSLRQETLQLKKKIEGYEEAWTDLLREVGLPTDSMEPWCDVVRLVDSLKDQIKQQDESRIKLATSC